MTSFKLFSVSFLFISFLVPSFVVGESAEAVFKSQQFKEAKDGDAFRLNGVPVVRINENRATYRKSGSLAPSIVVQEDGLYWTELHPALANMRNVPQEEFYDKKAKWTHASPALLWAYDELKEKKPGESIPSITFSSDFAGGRKETVPGPFTKISDKYTLFRGRLYLSYPNGRASDEFRVDDYEEPLGWAISKDRTITHLLNSSQLVNGSEGEEYRISARGGASWKIRKIGPSRYLILEGPGDYVGRVFQKFGSDNNAIILEQSERFTPSKDTRGAFEGGGATGVPSVHSK